MRVILLASLWGCGAPTSVEEGVSLDEGRRIPAERLDETWVVELATEQALAPFAAETGWVSLVMERNLRDAVRELGVTGGLGAARAHTEAAAMFRQAARLSGASLVQVYGMSPQPTDPLEASHLVGVGLVIRGEPDGARVSFDAVPAGKTDAWRAPWVNWIEAGAAGVPDLSALPLSLPEPTVGRWPRLGNLPHYRLQERHPVTGGPAAVRKAMGDPGALVALARWHDGVARTAAGDQAALLGPYRAGYGLPFEKPVDAAGPLPLELRFGSDLLTPLDGDFLVALHGAEGAAAVDAYADRSLLAWLARQARVEGAIDAESAGDLAVALRDDLMRRSRGRTEGRAQGHHRQFADIAMVGALRVLGQVAEVEGDRETSGRLQVRAWELSRRGTACPVALLSFAAWDASNRYPLRALDILHAQATRYPSLEVARYGLDALGLRVGQERTGETPGM